MENNLAERLLLTTKEQENTTNLRTKVLNESKTIWRIAFPGIIARVTSFGLIIVTQSFLGHVSDIQLATFAFVQSIFLRFINGILIGMSSATETLCGQAYGAGHYHMMGIYLQRSWIVDGVVATLAVPFFVFARQILRLLGEEEEIAVAAGPISLWFIPFLYNFVFALTIQMYLQAQMKNMIIGWLCAASFLLHLLVSWIFVYKLDWGVNGAMAALNISGWSTVIGEFVYIFGGSCRDTWKGFSKAAFQDILPVIKLSLSSGIMLCLELWYNSTLVLLAGYMKNATVAISALSICLNICAWEFMICLGFFAAACVRVANELGKGNAEAVKFSIKTILSTTTFIGLFFFVLCLVFGRQISYLFSSSEEVAESVSSLSNLLAINILLNSIQPVLSGVAIGAGMQTTVAVVNLGCYYVIGIPLGVVLGYVVNLQIKGLWIGMLTGVAMQTFVLSLIVWKTNWDNQVNKASERLNKWFLKPEEETNDGPSHA
ncbi:hypothetical protein SLEP1_g11631 [Rubroshorea leprosula]|nr:hypothetical protein SLEP1_g11631 [Rubroshorea leprosula]